MTKTISDFGISVLNDVLSTYIVHLGDEVSLARSEISDLLSDDVIDQDAVMRATMTMSRLKEELLAAEKIREEKLYDHKQDWSLASLLAGIVHGETEVAKLYLGGAIAVAQPEPPQDATPIFDSTVRAMLAEIPTDKPASPERMETLVEELEQLYREEQGVEFEDNPESIAKLREMIFKRNLKLVQAALGQEPIG